MLSQKQGSDQRGGLLQPKLCVCGEQHAATTPLLLGNLTDLVWVGGEEADNHLAHYVQDCLRSKPEVLDGGAVAGVGPRTVPMVPGHAARAASSQQQQQGTGRT